MVTFGVVADRSKLFPNAGKTRNHRDDSWIAEYQDAIRAVQNEGTGAGGYLQLDNMSDEAFNDERKRIKSAARKMGLVLNVRRVKSGEYQGHLGFVIDPDKTPPLTSYEKLKAEADSRGMTLNTLTIATYSSSTASAMLTDGRSARRPKFSSRVVLFYHRIPFP